MEAPFYRPLALDFFCGAGGMAQGLHTAGFTVIGVDNKPQPRYPFGMLQCDALEALEQLIVYGKFGADVAPAFVHASPPCQHYSDLAKRNGNAHEHPDLVGPTRELLKATGAPYSIENVDGAPLIDPVTLCGAWFGEWNLRVIRHRLFETNWTLPQPPHVKHPLCYTRDKRKAHYGRLDEMTAFVSVNGGGNCSAKAARDAMGIPWMTKDELNEAVPPAYGEYVGWHAMRRLGFDPVGMRRDVSHLIARGDDAPQIRHLIEAA